MKKIKKLVVGVLLTALSVCTLTGCGSKLPKDPAEIVSLMSLNAAAVKNYDAQITTNFKMTVGGEDTVMDMVCDMSVFTEPQKTKIVMKGSMGGSEQSNLELYLNEDKKEDKYFLYAKAEEQWAKAEVSKTDFETAFNEYAAQADIVPYLTDTASFKMLESVEEDGKKLTVLEGTVTGDALEKIMKGNGLMGQLGMQEISDEYLNTSSGVKVKLYVDNKTALPYKVTVDMLEFMKGIMDNAMKEAGLGEGEELFTISESKMDIKFTAFNNAKDFEIPKEALEAKALESEVIE